MKHILTSLVLATALFTWLAAAPGLAQGSGGARDCPDEKATPVEAHSLTIGPIVKCTRDYPYPYRNITVDGPPCPLGRIRYPAHSVCAGEHSEGTRCTWLGELPVERDTCKCRFLELWELRLPLLICTCEPAGIIGHVSTYGDFSCP